MISQEEFRAAIESRFNVEMSDEQFRALVDHVPLTNDGDVKYAEFMAQFDTRYVSPLTRRTFLYILPNFSLLYSQTFQYILGTAHTLKSATMNENCVSLQMQV